MRAGKTGVGKSSTANSIFAEHVAPVAAMQSDTSKATAFSRVAAGFTLTIIDTPGLLEADAVSTSVRGPVMARMQAAWSMHWVHGSEFANLCALLQSCCANGSQERCMQGYPCLPLLVLRT